MVESAPLLREYTLIAYRGFESLSLRQTVWSLQRVSAEKPENQSISKGYAVLGALTSPQKRTKNLSISSNYPFISNDEWQVRVSGFLLIINMIDHVEVLGSSVWKIDDLVQAFRQLLTPGSELRN